MSYKIRKATLDDIVKILPYSTEDGKTDKETLATTDEAKVILFGDQPLAIIGLEYLPGGTDEIEVGIWGLFNRDIEKHTKYIVNACRELIFQRVGFCFYALIDEDVPKFVRFAKFFGFERTECVERIEKKLYRMYMLRS